MFPITTKVKLAAGIAAGALALGGAGAYAANAAAQNTVKVTGSSFTIGTGTHTLKLVAVNGQTGTLTLPTNLTDPGQCVSFLATHRNFAIAPASGTTTVSKNFHGKLMSQANAFCKAQLPAKTKSDSADTSTSDTEQPEAPDTDTTDSTDSTAAQSGASFGHGHGHGHGAN